LPDKITTFSCTGNEISVPNQWSYLNGGPFNIPSDYTFDNLVSTCGYYKPIGNWVRVVVNINKLSIVSGQVSLAIYSIAAIPVADIRIICVWKKNLII
jgi:hypothetical protein